ncbi:MAG: 16S rRNA (guanine(966)-N(2))-methyltransferase RsmD [Pseudohongiellaceae bacterium]|nr:16S rRNA (guanine(966)-N(2))-methyltransferase RsmD [Pseudohongiellaceae bacterium]
MAKPRLQNSNTLRIIGGQWRSRKLSFPNVDGLRPTSDRVRETLFNWLQDDIVREDCLDLFAGSGACGLEALSRGARHVSFVDSSRKAVDSLRGNLQLLNAEGFQVFNQDAISWLEQCRDRPPSTQYGVVFLDPPFATNLLEKTVHLLEKSGILRENAYIYLESSKPITPAVLPLNWQMLKTKRAGQVHFALYASTGGS